MHTHSRKSGHYLYCGIVVFPEKAVYVSVTLTRKANTMPMELTCSWIPKKVWAHTHKYISCSSAKQEGWVAGAPSGDHGWPCHGCRPKLLPLMRERGSPQTCEEEGGVEVWSNKYTLFLYLRPCLDRLSSFSLHTMSPSVLLAKSSFADLHVD